MGGEISAVVDEGALADGNVVVGRETGIELESLKLLQTLLKLEIAGAISDLAESAA